MGPLEYIEFITSIEGYADAVEIAGFDPRLIEVPVFAALGHKAILQYLAINFGEDDHPLNETALGRGVIRAFPTEVIEPWYSGYLDLGKGTKYLDIHLIKPKEVRLTNELANEGYDLLADQIEEGNPEDYSHIIGVTYKLMAQLAKRNQDFNIQVLQLPGEIMKFASKTWQDVTGSKKEFKSAYLVWLTTEDFLKRPWRDLPKP